MFPSSGMTLFPSNQVLNWVETIIGHPIERIITLVGSTSSAVYQLTSLDKKIYVLRLFTLEQWLENEPDLARHEALALKAARIGQIQTPELIGFDETGELAGKPAVLMSMLPGNVDLKPKDINHWVDQLAHALFEIHQIEATNFSWRYKHWYHKSDLKVPEWTQAAEYFEKLIKLLKEPAPKMPEVFIHRDYHPANVLWQNGEVSGIVDWVNACVGPAMVDVSHCRLNLVSMFGVEVADKFLDAWLKLAGQEHYSLWWDVNGLANGWVFNAPISIYSGWADFGKTDITIELIASRLDRYVQSLAEKL